MNNSADRLCGGLAGKAVNCASETWPWFDHQHEHVFMQVQADFNFSMQQLSQQLSSQQLSQQLTNRQVANADLPMGMGGLGGGMGLGSLFQQETMNRLNQMSLPDVGLSQRGLGGPLPLGANLMGGLGGVPGQVVCPPIMVCTSKEI